MLLRKLDVLNVVARSFHNVLLAAIGLLTMALIVSAL